MRNAAMAASVLALLCLSMPAMADYLETFDSYAPGSSIIGQGNWVGWMNSNAPAYVSNAKSYSPGNSLLLAVGSDVVPKFSGYSSGQWVVEAYTYVASGSTGHANFIIKQFYDDANGHDNDATSIDWNMGNSQVTMAWATDGGPQALVYDQWIPIRFEVDLDARLVKDYYNGGFLGSYPYGTATEHDIAAFDIWTYGGYSGAVYFDNISITPEPATMALLALGGLALLRRKQR